MMVLYDKSPLSYFGLLLTCPECGAQYSPLMYLCPACKNRISGNDREVILRMEKARRIANALNVGKTIVPGEMFHAIYQRREKKYKIPSLRDGFAEDVLRRLVSKQIIVVSYDGFYVLKKPITKEVYDIIWGDESNNPEEIKKKHEKQRKHASHIMAQMNPKEGDNWVQIKEGKITPGCVKARFFSIDSAEGLDEAVGITKFNPQIKYNFDFTNSYRPVPKIIYRLIQDVPNLGFIVCSEWTWFKRLAVELKNIVKILRRPRGGVKRWTYDIVTYVRTQLENGETFGTICKNLNLFNIKISIKGIMKYHWREIKRPPPIFIW